MVLAFHVQTTILASEKTIGDQGISETALTYVEDAKATMKWVIESELRSSDPAEYARFMSLSQEDKDRYIKAKWKDFQLTPEKDCLDKMNALLHPLLNNALLKGVTNTIGIELTTGLAKKMNNAMEFHRVLKRLIEAVPELSSREKIQLYLPSYLMLFEGVFTSEVDLIVYLLTLSGKSPSFRYNTSSKNLTRNTSFKQIRSWRMRDKLDYLEEQGFGFAVGVGDYSLRNAIAHSNYTLSPDGTFNYYGRGKKVIIPLSFDEMKKKREDLLYEAVCFQRSAMSYYTGYFRQFLTTVPESQRKAWLDKVGIDLDELE